MKAGERLRAFREFLGINRSELARRLDVHPSYVGKLEDGKRDSAGMRFAHRLQSMSAAWANGPILVTEWLPAGESKRTRHRRAA